MLYFNIFYSILFWYLYVGVCAYRVKLKKKIKNFHLILKNIILISIKFFFFLLNKVFNFNFWTMAST
jgi:hypothetical protein